MPEREADELWLASKKHRKHPVYLEKLEGKTWNNGPFTNKRIGRGSGGEGGQ
jgi:hypothetical protein